MKEFSAGIGCLRRLYHGHYWSDYSVYCTELKCPSYGAIVSVVLSYSVRRTRLKCPSYGAIVIASYRFYGTGNSVHHTDFPSCFSTI